MISTIYGSWDDSVGQMIKGYFTHNSGYPITGPFSSMAWVKDGVMVGQAIFNDYTEANIEIHLHYPKGLTKNNIREVYKYVFSNLKCDRLTAKPFCTNEKLLHLLRRLGFVYEFTQKDYYRQGNKNIDAVVYKLTKNNIPTWVKLYA